MLQMQNGPANHLLSSTQTLNVDHRIQPAVA
jgi:hypothetical protein